VKSFSLIKKLKNLYEKLNECLCKDSSFAELKYLQNAFVSGVMPDINMQLPVQQTGCSSYCIEAALPCRYSTFFYPKNNSLHVSGAIQG